ncbi:MAG: hypothetical protein NC898_05560 [Candidatus Omnitrophica bacterium]|nr:hypothetical protein [Candidatus Omnitrophota bacterium]MCM8793909.1 hypothetical protein [Candidatus Omnitrophota bacterium]
MNKEMITEYREKAIEELNQLSDERIKLLLDFIEYLKEKEEWEETLKILRDKEIVDSLKRAESDKKAGRFSKWEKIKRNV